MGKIADSLGPLLEQAMGLTALTLANRLERTLGQKKTSSTQKTADWKMYTFQINPDEMPKAVAALKEAGARMGTNPMLQNNVDEYVVGNVRVHAVHNKGGNSLSYLEVGEAKVKPSPSPYG